MFLPRGHSPYGPQKLTAISPYGGQWGLYPPSTEPSENKSYIKDMERMWAKTFK